MTPDTALSVEDLSLDFHLRTHILHFLMEVGRRAPVHDGAGCVPANDLDVLLVS